MEKPWYAMPRLGRVRSRFRNLPSERKPHPAETSTRRGSGVLAGRRVRYPLHSKPVLRPDGIVFTELVNTRIVGYSEVIVGPGLPEL
jgi:hypothetical protein